VDRDGRDDRVGWHGVPRIVDEENCPASGGPFVITPYAVHGGQATVFFTYSIPPGSEAITRTWFESLLQLQSFNS